MRDRAVGPAAQHQGRREAVISPRGALGGANRPDRRSRGIGPTRFRGHNRPERPRPACATSLEPSPKTEHRSDIDRETELVDLANDRTHQREPCRMRPAPCGSAKGTAPRELGWTRGTNSFYALAGNGGRPMRFSGIGTGIIVTVGLTFTGGCGNPASEDRPSETVETKPAEPAPAPETGTRTRTRTGHWGVARKPIHESA